MSIFQSFILPLALFAFVVWLLYKLYKLRVRAIDSYYNDLLRTAKQTENAVLEAAWRAQLDREQLFRDYVKMEVRP